jgi:transposase
VTAEQIAGMAKRRLRLKIPKLTVALKDHQMSEHHRWLIEQSVEHSRTVDQQVEAIENRIKEKLKPYRSAYELLLTIPGITQNNAPAILAEIGSDMGQFASGDHLCSWAGICPGNNRAAGMSKSSHSAPTSSCWRVMGDN